MQKINAISSILLKRLKRIRLIDGEVWTGENGFNSGNLVLNLLMCGGVYIVAYAKALEVATGVSIGKMHPISNPVIQKRILTELQKGCWILPEYQKNYNCVYDIPKKASNYVKIVFSLFFFS